MTLQAVAWGGKQLCMSSRDLRTLYRAEFDPDSKIVEETWRTLLETALEVASYFFKSSSAFS